MRSMCVGVAETGVKAFLFLSFSFFSDKRKEHYKKSIFNIKVKSKAPSTTKTKKINSLSAFSFAIAAAKEKATKKKTPMKRFRTLRSATRASRP